MKRRDPIGGPASGGPRSPAWLTEQCPPWCTRDHREQDHPDDRYHQSTASIAPVIASARPSVPLTAALEPIDLVIRVGRYVGDIAEWMAIEPLELVQPRLVLTIESTRQLVRHLDEQLAWHDAG